MEQRQNKEHATYYLNFKPHPNIFNFGTNPLYLIDELCDLGQYKVFPRFDLLPGIDELDATKCFIYWDIFLATNQGINAISEVFIFADDQCDLKVQKISELNLLDENSFIGIIAFKILDSYFPFACFRLLVPFSVALNAPFFESSSSRSCKKSLILSGYLFA